MKTIKIVLLVATVSFFTSIPFSANAGHCDHIESGTKKTMCLLGLISGESHDSGSSDTSKKKKSNTHKSFWKKFKEMGGKNLGEQD